MGDVRITVLAFCLFAVTAGVPAAQAQWNADGNAVCSASSDQQGPELVSDGSGGAIIIWQDDRSYLDSNIYSQRVDATGQMVWTADGLGICTASDTQIWPDLVGDGSGGAIMTWSDSRLGGSYAVYAQKVDAAGSIQWAADGRWINSGASNSQVILDDVGGAYISWTEAATFPTSIALQRINSSGYAIWGSYVTAGTGNTSRLVADGSGGVVAGWQRVHTANSWIEGQRLDDDGTLLWPSVAITPSYGCRFEARLASDGAAGGIWVYEYYSDVIAQRMDAGGTKMWGASGTSPCPGIANSNAPQVVSDGSGGGLFVFEVDEMDIYINRIRADGTVAWGASAVVVCDDAAIQQDPHLAPDGYGGAYVVWEDHRDDATSGIDIYAQHFDADGVPQWAANGVPICTATGSQTASRIIATGDHDAIVTWQDGRSGAMNLDIYAQAIHYDGSIGDPPFAVLATEPVENAIGAGAERDIRVTFTTAVRVTSLSRSAIVAYGERSGYHSGTYRYNSLTRTVAWDPNDDFDDGEVVTVVLKDVIESAGGVPLDPVTFSFTTAAEGLDGEFLAGTNYAAQDSPHALCAADLDGDDDMDLAVANYNSGTVSVFAGAGNGTFAAQVPYSTGTHPHSVIAADINRDGDTDLVTADYGSAQVTVLFNDGSGAFPTSDTATVESGPESVFAGDLNADGFLDLATANLLADNISVLINDGTGQFGGDVVYAAGDNPFFITGGDLDGDGAIDLVTANLISDDISVFINKGTGYFEHAVNIPVGNGSNSVFPADLDRDGDLDLAIAAGSDNQMVLLFNNGDATFASRVLYATATYPYAGRPSDLDGDDDLDLVYGNANSGNIGIRRNRGAGIFGTQAVYAAGDFPNAIIAADFNEDGALDLASANRYDDTITVLMNKDWISDVDFGSVPNATRLGANVPNPFNPGTRIEFALARDGHVRLTIYNARGREITTLVDETLAARAHSVYWDGRDRRGDRVASGVYFYRLQTEAFKETRKMVLIK